jgi:hypothetical protein
MLLVLQSTAWQVTDASDLCIVIFMLLAEAHTVKKLAQLVEPMEVQMADEW